MCDVVAPVTFLVTLYSHSCVCVFCLCQTIYPLPTLSPALPVWFFWSDFLSEMTVLKHNTSLWVEQVFYKVCVWPLQDDLEQKWDIKMTVTSKWFPPIKFPLLSPSIIISLISATLCRQRRGSCLHPSTDELHFKFITSGMKKKKTLIRRKGVSESTRFHICVYKWGPFLAGQNCSWLQGQFWVCTITTKINGFFLLITLWGMC